MDLWQMVMADHANIAELCREVLRATGGGPNGRASLFDELDTELERHMRAKETVLYPAFTRYESTRRYVYELRQDHEQIRRDFDELAAARDKNSRDWSLNFKDLLSRIELYFTLEENGILNAAKRIIPPPQARALQHAYEREMIASLEAQRWHMPVAMMPSRYGLPSGTVFGVLASAAALGAAALLWRMTEQGTSSPRRPARRRPEPSSSLRSRMDADRFSRGGMAGRPAPSWTAERGREAGMPDRARDMADRTMAESDDARGNWFSSANPPRAPSGLASGLRPGDLAPGGGPGASVGSIGTGGGQTETRETGSLKRDGR